MSTHPTPPQDPHATVSPATGGVGRAVLIVAGTLGGLVLGFSLLAWLMYTGQPLPTTLPTGQMSPEEKLAVVQAEGRALHAFGWVDRERGVVRIPIELAMDKLVTEAGQGRGWPPVSADERR